MTDTSLTNFGSYKNRADFEKAIIDKAEYFTACKFLGRATYDTVKAKDLVGARRAARKLSKKHGGSVMIYAVSGIFTAHVENYVPNKSKR